MVCALSSPTHIHTHTVPERLLCSCVSCVSLPLLNAHLDPYNTSFLFTYTLCFIQLGGTLSAPSPPSP